MHKSRPQRQGSFGGGGVGNKDAIRQPATTTSLIVKARQCLLKPLRSSRDVCCSFQAELSRVVSTWTCERCDAYAPVFARPIEAISVARDLHFQSR